MNYREQKILKELIMDAKINLKDKSGDIKQLKYCYERLVSELEIFIRDNPPVNVILDGKENI